MPCRVAHRALILQHGQKIIVSCRVLSRIKMLCFEWLTNSTAEVRALSTKKYSSAVALSPRLCWEFAWPAFLRAHEMPAGRIISDARMMHVRSTASILIRFGCFFGAGCRARPGSPRAREPGRVLSIIVGMHYAASELKNRLISNRARRLIPRRSTSWCFLCGVVVTSRSRSINTSPCLHVSHPSRSPLQGKAFVYVPGRLIPSVQGVPTPHKDPTTEGNGSGPEP